MLPDMNLMDCQNLAVPMDVMHHVIRVESSFNPYAIGVVGGHLVRQPKNLQEAMATVRMLEHRGFNFSLGLAQVNRYNLGKYGIGSYEAAFEACPNVQAGSRILADCYKRSGHDWGRSFSCYYSGDFLTGYRHGYVQKIFASMDTPAEAIEVVGTPSRRVAGVSHHRGHANAPGERAAANADPAPRMPETAAQSKEPQPTIAVLAASGRPPLLLETTAQVAGPEQSASGTQDAAFVF